ncbi:amino acid transporter AVT6A-like [Canna indica]|uniref:Amino acid transporter AVT6A-like n=1 Tax=Canna indica TaxID=4628 RepID=A0AAQ3Q4E4_9LILI|nr:amino acid transporter AVT6A-like [Canna indica]
MTIGSEQKRNREKSVVPDDTTPLLPSKHDECRPSQEQRQASLAGAVFNLSTTIVGAGIMALPATMRVLGLIPGIIMIIFIALLTNASIEILIRFSRAAHKTTYAGAMGDAFGKIGRRVLQTLVVINNVGLMIVYLIIIGDVISGTSASGDHHFGLLEAWFGVHWWTSRAFVLLVVTLAVLAPLTSFKRIDSLRITSAVSVALAVVFVVITAGIAIYKLSNGSIAMPKLFPHLTNSASIWKLFTAVPVIVTAYVCHYNVQIIDNELHHSSQIHQVVGLSIVLCSAVYITTSFFAFLLFGESTLEDVLSNFDSDIGIPYGYVLNNIVRVSYVVHIMLVFPMIFFALRLNLDGLLFHKASPLASDNRRFVGITAPLLAVLYLCACFVPSIWDAFQITGATATVCIGFIFPASIVLKDPHGVATRRDRILSVFMMVLAVASSAVAIYSDIHSAFDKAKEG